MDIALDRYVFVPLALPPVSFDRDELCTWYDSNKHILGTVGDDTRKGLHYPWYCANIKSGPAWNQSFIGRFPQFQPVLAQLPFLYCRIGILEQRMEVVPHKDESRDPDSWLGPTSVRCPIIFDEPERTFYFIKDDETNREIVPTFPPAQGRWFAMNNYNAKHGSHMTSPGCRKLMLCFWGKVDPAPFTELLKQSIDLYADYCITL